MSQLWVPTKPTIERRGGNSRVIQVKNASGNFSGLAAKKILLTERFAKYARFTREVRIATELSHPSIVPVLDSHLPPVPSSSDPPYMVMPWLDGGSLTRGVQDRTYVNQPASALQVLLPILEAVQYLHNQDKFHRDIKPSNIVLDERARPFLTDFGLAFDLDDDERLTLTEESIGSLGYRAPDYIGGRYAVGDHAPGDIFSLGKTLWALLSGEQAPEGTSLQYPTYNLIARFRNPDLDGVQQLIQWMTRENPVDRPTIADLIAEVNLLLSPPKKFDERRVGGAELGRQLRTFMETDPALARLRQTELEEAQASSDVRILLENLRRQIEQDSNLLKLQAEHADTLVRRMVSVGGPEPFCPADFIVRAISENTPGLDAGALARGQAVYVMYRPPNDLAERMPMVIATWTVIRNGRTTSILSYVYAVYRGGQRPWRGTVPIQGKVHFRSHLNAPSLRSGLLGLAPRQISIFLEMLAGYLAQARGEVVPAGQADLDKTIKQTFPVEAEQLIVRLGLYPKLLAAMEQAGSDPQRACCNLAHVGYDLLDDIADVIPRLAGGPEERGIAELDFRITKSKVEEMCGAMGIRVHVSYSRAREVIISPRRFEFAVFQRGLRGLAEAVQQSARIFRVAA